jgi:hypothetical protein
MKRAKKGEPPPYQLKKVGKHRYAYVRLNGTQVMLGQHGSPESRREYARMLREWEANGLQLSDYLRGRRSATTSLGSCVPSSGLRGR